MELETCRKKIDDIDRNMMALFAERMEAAGEIAAYKKEHGLPLFDAEREKEKIAQVADMLPPALSSYGVSLMRQLMDLSKQYQQEAQKS